MTTFLLMIFVFAICLFIGVPIAISIGVSTLVSLFIQDISLGFISQIAYSGLDNYTFIAVPMFILAGYMMEIGGISKRLIDFASSLVGRVNGGLAIVAVIACTFFAAISGSSGATVAAIGAMLVPTMIKKGYHKEFAGAITASAGSLGILIPPSIAMIIYAVIADVSVGKMFVAGIVPGLIISMAFIILTYFISKKRRYEVDNTKVSMKRVLSNFWNAKWALLVPVLVLGGIYSGIFTPTEASVITVLYAFIIAFFVYKELRIKDIPKVLIESAVTSGSVLIILGLALAFGRFLTLMQIPQQFAQTIFSFTDSKFIILLIFIFMIFITGIFMETTAQILIYPPLFLPILLELGVDPIHFGIILIIGTEIGLLTPPVGTNLFIAQGVTGAPIGRLAKAIIPFILLMLVIQLILTFVPGIVTFLPNLLYK